MASEQPATATTATGPGTEGKPVPGPPKDAVTPAAEGRLGNGAGPTLDGVALEDPGAADPLADLPSAGEVLAADAAGRPHPWAVVMVFDIAVDLPTPHALVTLREVAEPHRLVAIPVGLPEATALAHAWRGVATPRPLTHELFSDVLTRLGATMEVVRLTGRRAGVVLAELELSTPRGREVVPCRPSDGVTLAVRQGVPAPILVDIRLFEADGDVEAEV